MPNKREDRRLIRRNEKARLVMRPSGLELTRRSTEEKPGDALKAAVVAALMIGQPAVQIAQQFGLSPALVRRWEEAFDITNPLERRDRLSEILLVFVEQEIASLLTISIATSDPEWIKEQSASELAVFIGTKQDRLMKILEAFSRAQQSKQTIQGTVVTEENGE